MLTPSRADENEASYLPPASSTIGKNANVEQGGRDDAGGRGNLRQQPARGKSLRLQNADLTTEYNLYECDLARPKVTASDFHCKAAHMKFREREHQPAMLCTLVMTNNIDSTGVARYPVDTCQVMDPATGATLVDELGRRSWASSIAFGPSIGKNIALAYLPHAYCQVGCELQIQYFADVYPVKVEAVGYRSLYDPESVKPRS